jgi:citronellyl-CoA dehydrogenase
MDTARAAPQGDAVRDAVRSLPSTATAAEVWRELGRAGLIEALYRDAGCTRVHPGRLRSTVEALDGSLSAGPVLGVCVQAATVLPLLGEAAAGSPAVARLHERMRQGRAVVALAATDTGSGCDLTGLGSEARLGAAEVVLNGRKRWATNATTADYFLVLARHRPGRHFTSFTHVLAPAGHPGVCPEPADTDLFAGSGVGHVGFAGVRVPRDHVVGRVGHGLAAFARHIATERLAGAMWGTAMSRRVIAATRRRLAERASGDGTLWDQPVIRQRLAEATVRLSQLEALCRVQADPVAERHDSVAAAVLKAAVAAAVEYILGVCAPLQGADGFARDGAQRLRAEAAIFGIGGGATEVVLGAVADHLDELLRSEPV